MRILFLDNILILVIFSRILSLDNILISLYGNYSGWRSLPRCDSDKFSLNVSRQQVRLCLSVCFMNANGGKESLQYYDEDHDLIRSLIVIIIGLLVTRGALYEVISTYLDCSWTHSCSHLPLSTSSKMKF